MASLPASTIKKPANSDRVHDSDIKKLIQWYNILVNGGYTKFVDESEAAAETAEAAE